MGLRYCVKHNDIGKAELIQLPAYKKNSPEFVVLYVYSDRYNNNANIELPKSRVNNV
jgi:hypothetical protein